MNAHAGTAASAAAATVAARIAAVFYAAIAFVYLVPAAATAVAAVLVVALPLGWYVRRCHLYFMCTPGLAEWEHGGVLATKVRCFRV